jgi:predicted Zn-dependent protease
MSRFYDYGRLAGAKFLKAKWMWQSVAGNDAEAIRAEHGVGRTMADAIREQAPVDVDPLVRDLLRGIQARLAERVNNPLHRFDVTSTEESQPTAYALPGGFIFVARSLVELCDRDTDELGFVVGHEMAHVVRRHAMDRLLGQAAISAAAMASPGRGALAAWIKRVGVPWLERAYSREQEFEADELGGLLMKAAGFDPAGSVRALQRFQRLDPAHDERGLGAYLSTHPPVADRIARLRERLDLRL